MIVVQTPFLSPKIKIGGYQKSALPPKSHFLDNTGLQKAYQHSYSVQTSLCPPTMVDLVLIFKEWAKFPIQAVFFSQYKETTINGCCISSLVWPFSMPDYLVELRFLLWILFFFILIACLFKVPSWHHNPIQSSRLVSTDKTAQHLRLASYKDLFWYCCWITGQPWNTIQCLLIPLNIIE